MGAALRCSSSLPGGSLRPFSDPTSRVSLRDPESESQDLVAVRRRDGAQISWALPKFGFTRLLHASILPPCGWERYDLVSPPPWDLFTTRIGRCSDRRRQDTCFLARDRMTALEQERALKQEGVDLQQQSQCPGVQGGRFLPGLKTPGPTTQARGSAIMSCTLFQLINPRTSEITSGKSAEVKDPGRCWKTPPTGDRTSFHSHPGRSSRPVLGCASVSPEEQAWRNRVLTDYESARPRSRRQRRDAGQVPPSLALLTLGGSSRPAGYLRPPVPRIFQSESKAKTFRE